MNAVATEVAEEEFARFCEVMDLDIDESKMEADDLKDFASTKRKVLRAIESGNLVIEANGEPVFTPQSGENREPIRFKEPTGATILALDNAKKGKDVHKAFHALADFTGQPLHRYAKMQNRDFKVCQALMTLFLG